MRKSSFKIVKTVFLLMSRMLLIRAVVSVSVSWCRANFPGVGVGVVIFQDDTDTDLVII